MFIDYRSNTLNLVHATMRYREIENVQFLTFDTFDHHPKAPKSVVTNITKPYIKSIKRFVSQRYRKHNESKTCNKYKS